MKTITHKCRICGNPITLEVDDDCDQEHAEMFARMVVCDHHRPDGRKDQGIGKPDYSRMPHND